MGAYAPLSWGQAWSTTWWPASSSRPSPSAVVSTGGRVVSVVGTGASLAVARAAAYELAGRVDLPGGQHRTDIASGALAGEVAVPA